LIATGAEHLKFSDIVAIIEFWGVDNFKSKAHFREDSSCIRLNYIKIVIELLLLVCDTKIGLYL
jgi:hypothetical protein